MRDLTELHRARNFMRYRRDLQRRPHRSRRLRSCLLGEFLNEWCVRSLNYSFGFDWDMDVDNGFEGREKMICKVGSIENWVCVERWSEGDTFEIGNIDGIVGAVLDGCPFNRMADVREGFESERFVIGLVRFMMKKVCDNSGAGSCDEKIKGVTILMSCKVDVLCVRWKFSRMPEHLCVVRSESRFE